MSKTTTGGPRRLCVRAALAALAIAAAGAAPVAAFAGATHPATVSADPNDVDWTYIPDGGAGGGGGGG